MSGVMVETAKELTPEQIAYLEDELKVTESEILSFDEEKWYEVYDVLCDIEVDELCNLGDDDEEPPRCVFASDLVTLFGNAMAEEKGLLDEEEFERELHSD